MSIDNLQSEFDRINNLVVKAKSVIERQNDLIKQHEQTIADQKLAIEQRETSVTQLTTNLGNKLDELESIIDSKFLVTSPESSVVHTPNNT
jgi:predicted  nucleic acid-binding Zn-ribbon protein